MKNSIKITLSVIMILSLLHCTYTPKCDGVDVSHYNSVKDFKDNLESIQFIIAKATEGSDIKDSKFKEYRSYAYKHGLKFGAYHFLTKESSIKNQFEHYKNVVGKKIDIIPCVDIEKTGGKHWSKVEARKAIKEWSELCMAYYGKYPIVYCNDFYRLFYFYDMPNYFWITNWHFRPFAKCVIHQYSNNDETIDYNYLHTNINNILLN